MRSLRQLLPQRVDGQLALSSRQVKEEFRKRMARRKTRGALGEYVIRGVSRELGGIAGGVLSGLFDA